MTTSSPQVHRPPAVATVADVEQHSLPKSVALHLVPGILTAAVFYALAPALTSAGYPTMAAAVLAVGLVLLSAELGWLLREARRRTGSSAITAVMPFRPGPFTWRKVLLVVGLFTWAVGVSLLGIGGIIKASFFTWMPGWALDPLSVGGEPGSTVNIVTAVGHVVFLVILGPLVEELYFRGYLLPRIGRFGAWAVVINVSLFGVYHLWKPWDAINLIIILAPMVYAVWRLKDVRIGITVHIALNTLALFNILPRLL